MKAIQRIAAILAVTAFTACTPNSKRVVIMASGKVTVTDNAVSLQPGNTHNITELEVKDEKITVNTPAGANVYPLPKKGLYLLNLKNDTLVGSYQRLGKASTAQYRMTQADLKRSIDSVQQLMAGHANDSARTYALAPNQIIKITDNLNAQIIGPYMKMPTSFQGGSDLEIYKFYTNNEMQETVDRLKEMVDSASAGHTDTTSTRKK